jgi:hypothetical protein
VSHENAEKSETNSHQNSHQISSFSGGLQSDIVEGWWLFGGWWLFWWLLNAQLIPRHTS